MRRRLSGPLQVEILNLSRVFIALLFAKYTVGTYTHAAPSIFTGLATFSSTLTSLTLARAKNGPQNSIAIPFLHTIDDLHLNSCQVRALAGFKLLFRDIFQPSFCCFSFL